MKSSSQWILVTISSTVLLFLLLDATSAFSTTPSTDPSQTRRDWIFSTLFSSTVVIVAAPKSALAEQESSSSSSSSSSFTVELQVQLQDNKLDTIEIEVHPEWAPLAADRFRELVTSGFYDDARFFRVLPNYVAQFGIASDPALNKEWIFCERNCKALSDERRRVVSNDKGTLSFASSGKNSRQTQVFINLGNNGGPPNFLDGQGFVPFAKVTKGMDSVVGKLNSEYGLKESLSGGMMGSVNQGKAAYYGKEYLDTVFPGLSYIKSAKIL